MDAAREQALIDYATRCHRDADRLPDDAPPDLTAALLREHLHHSGALAVLLLSCPPSPAPPAPWWRRIVRAVRAGWAAL